MKFITFLSVVFSAATVTLGVIATRETNGQRLARGLPPLPPVGLGTPVNGAKRSVPSQWSYCSAGTLQCCEELGSVTDPSIAGVLASLGINDFAGEDLVGIDCSPLGSASPASCTLTPACCTGNAWYGTIAFGCSPVST